MKHRTLLAVLSALVLCSAAVHALPPPIDPNPPPVALHCRHQGRAASHERIKYRIPGE